MNESRYFEAAQNCERRSYLFLNGFLVTTFLVLHWYENKYKELQIADLNSRWLSTLHNHQAHETSHV